MHFFQRLGRSQGVGWPYATSTYPPHSTEGSTEGIGGLFQERGKYFTPMITLTRSDDVH